MRRHLAITALLCLVTPLLACAWRATDRRWISDRRFHQVWRLYDDQRNIGEIRRVLEMQPWRPGEINEALYRIEQLERARGIHGQLQFPPRGEPRPLTGTAIRLR